MITRWYSILFLSYSYPIYYSRFSLSGCSYIVIQSYTILHLVRGSWLQKLNTATLTFRALHTGRPPYLSDLLQYHEPTRSLRSSSSHQLSVPRHNLTFGSRAFRLSAPRVRNSLPVSIRETKSLPAFRRHLKTHYFQSVYPHSSVHLV